MSEHPPVLLRTPTMESEAPPPYTRELNATTGEQTLDQGLGSSRNHASGSDRPSPSAEQSNPKPTHNPTPGHPLLRYGRVLIYPQGFLCRECFNKGYKPDPEFADTFHTSAYAPGDPGHPCLTCWGKYGQEYTDELAQMDWSNETTVNRQRPIYTVDHAVRGSQYYHLKGSSNYSLGYEPPNDGKPTSTPFPGHPLLRYNQVLVYPIGFKCDKCFNRGFKSLDAIFNFQSGPHTPGDPSHPCKTCWQQYGTQYPEDLKEMDWLETVDTHYQQPICPPRSNHVSQVNTPGLGDSTEDDGKPTSRPLGGHPLLRYGQVLIYPSRFVCQICFNKGFQPKRAKESSTVSAFSPGDPSHPCHTCWRKFGKEYTEELAKLDWKNADATFQKPISRSNARY